MYDFGKMLREYRIANKLSQGTLADELEMTRNQISSYENGTINPSLNTFLRICDYFNVSPNEMVGIKYDE